MSATIYARQVKPCEGESLSCGWPSSFITAMEQAFHKFPVELDYQSIPILTGMAATCYEARGKRDNPYQELIEHIERWKVVEVYAVY